MILPICNAERCIRIIKDPPGFLVNEYDDICLEILEYVKNNYPAMYFSVLRECPMSVILKASKYFYELFLIQIIGSGVYEVYESYDRYEDNNNESPKRVCITENISDIFEDLTLLENCTKETYLQIFRKILWKEPLRLFDCFKYGTPEIVETLRKEKIYLEFVESLKEDFILPSEIESMYI